MINLATELRKRGHDVEVVSFNVEGDKKYLKSWSLWKDLNPTIINVSRKEDGNEQVIEAINVSRKYIIKDSHNFDRIIIDSWFTFVSAVESGLIDSRFFQLVQSDPEFISEDSSKIWKSKLFSILPRIKVNRIVVSKVHQELFKERYSQETKRIQLFIRKEFFEANYKVREREKIKLVSSSADFNIQSKGFDFMKKVLNKFSVNNDFELLLISGNPIQKDKLKGLNFKIEEKTAEKAEEMVEFLKEGDVYLNTSSKESFCLALAEAMVMGIPSVALDSVGNREYVNSKNAKFAKNEKEFLRGLDELLKIEERKRISKESKISMKKYRLEKMVDDFEKAIGI